MIIYNTTYHVSQETEGKFVEWLKCEYIAEAIKSGVLIDPQLVKILGETEGGNSYSLQFKCESIDLLDTWYSETGRDLLEKMLSKFGQQVTGFSTLMELINLNG